MSVVVNALSWLDDSTAISEVVRAAMSVVLSCEIVVVESALICVVVRDEMIEVITGIPFACCGFGDRRMRPFCESELCRMPRGFLNTRRFVRRATAVRRGPRNRVPPIRSNVGLIASYGTSPRGAETGEPSRENFAATTPFASSAMDSSSVLSNANADPIALKGSTLRRSHRSFTEALTPAVSRR